MTSPTETFQDLKRSVEQAKKEWYQSLDNLIRQFQTASTTTTGTPVSPSVTTTMSTPPTLTTKEPFYPILDEEPDEHVRVPIKSIVQKLPSSLMTETQLSTEEWLKKRFNDSRMDEKERLARQPASVVATASTNSQSMLKNPITSVPKKYTLSEALASYVPTPEQQQEWNNTLTSHRYALPGIPWNILTEDAQRQIMQARKPASLIELQAQEQKVSRFAIGGTNENTIKRYGGDAENNTYQVPTGQIQKVGRFAIGGTNENTLKRDGGDAENVTYQVPTEQIPHFPIQIQNWNQIPPVSSTEPIVPPELVEYYEQYLRQHFSEDRSQLKDPDRGYGYHISATLPPIHIQPNDPAYATLVRSPATTNETFTTDQYQPPQYWEKVPAPSFSSSATPVNLSSVPFRYHVVS